MEKILMFIPYECSRRQTNQHGWMITELAVWDLKIWHHVHFGLNLPGTSDSGWREPSTFVWRSPKSDTWQLSEFPAAVTSTITFPVFLQWWMIEFTTNVCISVSFITQKLLLKPESTLKSGLVSWVRFASAWRRSWTHSKQTCVDGASPDRFPQRSV